MPISNSERNYVKVPNSLSYYDSERAKKLVLSAKNLEYFCENFVKIQHPIKGSVPFELYDFQRRLLRTFQNYKYVIAMCARQMGKCVEQNTLINIRNKKEKISSFINFSTKEKIINFLENLLIKLSK